MTFQLTDEDVITACSIMRGVLQRRLSRLGRLSLHDQATADLVEIQ